MELRPPPLPLPLGTVPDAPPNPLPGFHQPPVYPSRDPLRILTPPTSPSAFPYDSWQTPLAPFSAASGSRRSDQSAGVKQHGNTGSDQADALLDLDEDLAECIAAWQESGHAGQPSDFVRLQVQQKREKISSREAAAQYARAPAFDHIFPVNVGGTVFRTTANTLRKARFFESMMKYAEEGVIGTTTDEGGRLFVDRPSELFSYILEYLRTGTWVLRDKAGNPEFVEALREEAGFYGIDSFEGTAFLPAHRIAEYVMVWQFQEDTSVYVDSHEQTIREDPDHQGLFRLCKYSGGLPLDQQTCTKRFKATSHSVQAVIAYFALRGFRLQHIIEGSMITHTTSVDGQSRSGHGAQYILSRYTSNLCSGVSSNWTPPNTHRGSMEQWNRQLPLGM